MPFSPALRSNFSKLQTNPYAIGFVACIVVFLCYKFYVWTKTETTDNAYVEADISIASCEVGGVVTKIFCTENQLVEEGEVLAIIDDTDYKAGLEKASFAAEAARYGREATLQKLDIEKINIEKLEDNLQFAKENYEVSQRDYDRTSTLADDNFSSRKTLDNASIVFKKAKLEFFQAKFNLDTAIKNVALLETQKSIDEANASALLEAQSIAANALKNTAIRAGVAGVVTNIGMKTGNFIRQGQPLAALVPVDKLYIKANFKETQVTNLRAGMKAWISFDGISGRKIKGYIKSISPASGSKFSLIPTDNATGNFTKVVQRFPVIIEFRAPKDIEGLVRAGMSVSVSIRR